MNILYTSKSRVIILMLMMSLFGLRLTASASARIRMVCDTDTTAKKKASLPRNADTILMINGVPTRVSKSSANVKPDQDINMANGAKADSIAKGFKVAPTPQIRAIYTVNEGTIQVKNNPNDQPLNTTIVAPPTDGVIQVRATATQKPVTTIPPPVATAPALIPVPTGKANKTARGAQNKRGVKHDTTVLKHNVTTILKHDTTTILKRDTVTLLKHDTVLKRDNPTILKKDTTTIIKKDTTTILHRDTITIIKRDTITINKRDTINNSTPQAAAQDTSAADFSQARAKSYYLQIGGAGLAISANYDARFNEERNGWGYTVGIGGFAAEGNSVITVPFQVNYLIGEHASMLQVGGGATFLHSTGNNTGKTWSFDKITGFVATGSVGYRYQPEQKGISFKIEFVPIMYNEGVIPAGGISIGYTFK